MAMREPVIALESPAPHVAVVRMQDRSGKNTFTPGLSQALAAAFTQIGQDTNVRSVVLAGYDTYFASGGSGEALLAPELSQMSRETLVLRKRHLSDALRAQLPDCVERELAMHSLTFRSPEVHQRIASLFGN